MAAEFRIVIEGGEADMGPIPAADIAKAIFHVESAIAKAMGHATFKPVRRTGRWRKAIEEAVRFRFVAVEKGSVGLLCRMPDVVLPDGALQLEGDTSLAELGLRIAIDAAQNPDQARIDVVEVWADLGFELAIGQRYTAFRVEGVNGASAHRVRVDGAQTERLRTFVRSTRLQAVKQDRVRGQLYEADFDNKTAKVRTPRGVVEVTFADDLSDPIYDALRHQAEIVGDVEYDPRDSRALSITARYVSPPVQLLASDFWDETPVADRFIGRTPVNVRDLALAGVTDAEWAGLFAGDDE